jgi:hypothetical protein
MSASRHKLAIRPKRRARKRRRMAHRRRRWLRWRSLLVIPALAVLLLGVSLAGAAVAPGNVSFEAKWADWLRANHAGWLAQHVEELYYSANAPAKGGRPKGLNRVPVTVDAVPTSGQTSTPDSRQGAAGYTTVTRPTTTTTTVPPGLPPPTPVPLVLHPGLPGEGVWQPTGPLVGGVPAMYVAQFRADDVYTSQITSAVWIDPKLLRLELVPGSTEPGGTWSHPPYVTPTELPYLVAAFNGGFRFNDARGGIYLDGKWGVAPVGGAASFAIYQNGHINIGEWGTQINMTPDVAAILQNVVLLVNHGQLVPSATYTDNAYWGYTLGGGYVVPRSGIGVTADGALVYVAGPALTAKSLAESLQRAGAVRAMTLDINPEWVTFNFYSHAPGHPAELSGTKLYPGMQRSADRYRPPVHEARDFFEVLLPGSPAGG